MRYVIQDLKHRYYRYTSKGVQWHIDINKATVFDSRRAAKITLSRVGNGETLFLVPIRSGDDSGRGHRSRYKEAQVRYRPGMFDFSDVETDAPERAVLTISGRKSMFRHAIPYEDLALEFSDLHLDTAPGRDVPWLTEIAGE